MYFFSIVLYWTESLEETEEEEMDLRWGRVCACQLLALSMP